MHFQPANYRKRNLNLCEGDVKKLSFQGLTLRRLPLVLGPVGFDVGDLHFGRLFVLINGETPMIFLVDERAAVLSTSSSSASPRCAGLADAQETKPDAFSAKPKVLHAASVLRSQLG